MIRFLRKLKRCQNGAIMAYTAILLPIFIGFIALGLDVASWHIDKRQIQTMADSAAIAAGLLRDINESDDDLDDDDRIVLYEAAALDAAQRNGFDANAGFTIEVNSPPTMGITQGTDGAIEVIIQTQLPIILSGLITEGDSFATSRAVVLTTEVGTGCIWALSDDADGAITVAGTATVTIGCGVFSNSSSDESIQLNGLNSCITATEISAAGGVDGGAGNCFTPDPGEDAGGRPDPLRNLPEPENTGCDHNGKTKFTGQSDGELNPGTYCGDIQINSGGTVTFNSGMYILDGADLSISAQSTVVGSGVTIFIADDSSITINGGADVQLAAPSSGTYQGILIFQSGAADEATHKLTGGADMNLEGIVYTPNSAIQFSGNADADSEGLMVIADTVNFTGTADFGTVDTSDPGSIFFNLDILEGASTLVE